MLPEGSGILTSAIDISKQTTVHNRPINLWTNIFYEMMAFSNLIAKVEVEKAKFGWPTPSMAQGKTRTK